MKKYLFLSGTLLSFYFVNSQNIFPPSGNVGIGTISPTEKLEVNGVAKVKNLYATNLGTNNSNFSSFQEWFNNSLVFSAGYEMSDSFSAISKKRMLNFYDMHSWGSGNDVIQPNDDYFALEVVDRNNLQRFYFEGHKGGGPNNGRSSFVINNKSGHEIYKVMDDGSNNIALQMGQPNSRIILGGFADYEPTHKLVVKNGSALIEGNVLADGNVGIGTDSFTDGNDTYRLSVNGSVRANRVRVYTDWADYVFDENYYLPTLAQVEKHIKENGHLKDIPSANTVEKEGIELGEMNKLLLQKVEELTLYLIAMQKELDDLKSKINNEK